MPYKNIDIPHNNIFLLLTDILVAVDHLIEMGKVDNMKDLKNKCISFVTDLLQEYLPNLNTSNDCVNKRSHKIIGK